MLKWIASGCLVIIVIVAGVSYYGYRQVTKVANQPPTTVSMAATPERVFASLANIDSMSTWRTSTPAGSAGRTGMLAVGDTLREEEGIAYATFDLADCIEPKQFHDIVGYYNRFDVFTLSVDRHRIVPIVFSDEPAAPEPRPAGRDAGPATPGGNERGERQ